MSNPSKAPRQQIVVRDGLVPDCHFTFMSEKPAEGQKQNAWSLRCKEAKQIDKNVELLAPLDMDIEEPFVIPLEFTVDKQAHQQEGLFYAMAKRGGVSTRPRTGVARALAQGIYDAAPAVEKPLIAEQMRTMALVDAGTEFTLGRLLKYYPFRGSIIKEPITRLEAVHAWEEELGLVLTDTAYQAYVMPAEWEPRDFIVGGEGVGIRANLSAGNGFPVLGKGNDPEAQSLYLGLALKVRDELKAAYEQNPETGVKDWKRTAERERPWLVALQGKCKADYYTGEKVWNKEMRFYNVMGRQMALNIQTMFQVVEDLAQSALDSAIGCSVSGVSFTHGGAARLVQQLSHRVHILGSAHVRMGDDSWVIVEEPPSQPGGDGILHMFALDCSAFDLTQHSHLTHHIHQRLLEIASQVDPVAAALQHAYFRERLVVTVRRDARRWRHGGASGIPGQSKVNGAIMGVCVKRVLNMVHAKLIKGDLHVTEQRLNDIISLVGKRMGLTIKVEQYSSTVLSGNPRYDYQKIEQALQNRPFLFMGFNFRAHQDSQVTVFADMPRSLSRIRYPNLLYVPDRADLEALEAARLSSVITSMGLPGPDWCDAHRFAVKYCITLVEAVLANPGAVLRTEGQILDVAHVTAVTESKVQPPSTYEGLLRLLQGGFARIWGYVPADQPLDREECRGVNMELTRRKRFEPTIPPLPVTEEAMNRAKIRVPSRLPTEATAGRNPNTKVFGPARKPKSRYFELRRVAPNLMSMLYTYDEYGWKGEVANDVAMEYASMEDEERSVRSAFGSEDSRDTYEDHESPTHRDRSVYGDAPFSREQVYLDDPESEEYMDKLRWGPLPTHS